MVQLDPILLSRQLERANTARLDWETRLKVAADPNDAPLGLYRDLLSADQFAATTELPADDPLKRSLLRWLFKLIERRVNHQGYTLLNHQRYQERFPLAREEQQLTRAELLERALSDAPQRERWLKVLSEHAAPLAETAKQLRFRRVEVAERLHVDSLDSIELPGQAFEEHAASWLQKTAPLTEEAPARSWPSLMQLTLTYDVAADWPTRVEERAIAAWFRGTRLLESLNLKTPALPKTLAPASFMRALEMFGRCWLRAAAPTTQPFVLAHDPYELAAQASGALFAGLPLNPAFAARELGVVKSAIEKHGRLLARVVLRETRLRAVKVLLRSLSLTSQRQSEERFQQLVADELGLELVPQLLDVAIQLREDDVQHFYAPFSAALKAEELTNHHDVDWYRNPRAVDQLRSEAQHPPLPDLESETLEQGQDQLLAQLGNLLR